MYSNWRDMYEFTEDFMKFYGNYYSTSYEDYEPQPEPAPRNNNVIDMVMDASGVFTSVNVV